MRQPFCNTGDVDFTSAYAHGFARVAACTVPVAIADPATNAATVLAEARACHDEGVAVAIFPELCLSGYAIDDLVMQDVLLDAVDEAIGALVEASADLRPVLVVGAPLRKGNRLFNCAVVIHGGVVLGVAPKSYLPTYREFYEARHFASGEDQHGETITVRGVEVPFGPDLLFQAPDVPGLPLHVEICEDMWVPVPPSANAALAGATVLANLSGSPITVARAEDRRLLVRSASARCLAAYLYAAAGEGESSTDLSWDGQTMVYECGDLLGESERFPEGPRRTVVDVDLDRIRQERLRQGILRRQPPRGGAPAERLPGGRVHPRPAQPATSGCAARSTGSRSCPTTSRGWPWTATRPTTSRSPGSSSGCARSGSPRSSSASPAASTRRTR